MGSTEVKNLPLIFETSGAKIISPITNKVVYRTARFLQPRAENVNQAADIPHIPLLCEVFPHHLQQWQSKVLFKGWKCPQKDWKLWVEVLAAKHKTTWERSGIHDAILSSTYEVRCNPDVILGLAEFWCPETSTFLFPWGEATVTLEDTMILGGFSVSGKSVPRFPPRSLVKLVEKMDNQRREFGRMSKSKKASHSEWLKRFMQVGTSTSSSEAKKEFEHVAFLSLWLSRYVFPQLPADEVVGKYVFPIAAHLSQGTTVALGPAVLASLYRDLTYLKKEAMSFSKDITVAAPFQLLQIWAFERFPSLERRKAPNSLFRPGEPRAARWSKINSRVNLQLVKSTVKLEENFLWRPYADDNSKFKSPAQCLMQAAELIGIDCKEKYQPQRVAMQFGFDQDIPGRIRHGCCYSFDSLERINSTRRSIEPGVSAEYLRWREDSLYARGKLIREIVERKGSRISSSANAIGRRRPENFCTSRRFQVKRHARSPSPTFHHGKDNRQPCVSSGEIVERKGSRISSSANTIDRRRQENFCTSRRFQAKRYTRCPSPTFHHGKDNRQPCVSSGEIVERKGSRISSSANAIDRRRQENFCTSRRFQAKRYARSPSPTFHHGKDNRQPCVSSGEIVERKGSRISSSANAIDRRRQENFCTSRRFQAKRYARSPSPTFHHGKDHRQSCVSSREQNEDEIDLLPISKLPVKRSTTAASILNRKNVEKPIQGSENNNDHDDTLDFLVLSKRIKKESPVKFAAAGGLWSRASLDGNDEQNTCDINLEPEKESAVKAAAAEGLPGASSATGNDGYNRPEFEERLRRLENLMNLKLKTHM